MRSFLIALFALALCGLFAADVEASCRPRHGGRRGCNRGEGRLLHRHHRDGGLLHRRHMGAAPEQLSAPKPVKKEMPKTPPAPAKPTVTVTYENVPAIAPFIDWTLPVEVLPAPGD